MTRERRRRQGEKKNITISILLTNVVRYDCIWNSKFYSLSLVTSQSERCFICCFFCECSLNLQWSCKEHLKQMGKWANTIALNLDTHSHSDKQHTAGHKRRLYAIFSNKRTKLNNVFQTIPSDVPFKQWHVVLDPRSSSCGCSSTATN